MAIATGEGTMPLPDRDPRVIRVLLRYREAVAVATERAYRELLALGVSDPAAALHRPQTLTPRQGTPLHR